MWVIPLFNIIPNILLGRVVEFRLSFFRCEGYFEGRLLKLIPLINVVVFMLVPMLLVAVGIVWLLLYLRKVSGLQRQGIATILGISTCYFLSFLPWGLFHVLRGPLNLGSPSFLGVCSTFSGDLSTWALLPSLGSVLRSQGTSQPGLSFLPWGLFYVLRGPLNLGSPSFLGVCSTFSGDLSTWALLPSLGSVLRSQGTSQPGLSFLPWGLFYVLRGPLNLGSPSFLGVCSTFSGDLSTWALLPSLGSVPRSQGTSQPGLSFLPWGLFYVLRGPLNLGSPSFLGVCSTFSGDLSTWALLPSLGSVLRSQGTSQPGLSFLPWGLFYVLRGPLNLGSPSFLGVCSTFSGDLSTWALLPSLGSVLRSQGTSQPGLSFLPWGLFYVLRGPLNMGSPSFLGVCSTFSGDLSTWALLPSLGSVLRSQGTSQPGLSFLPWGLFYVLRGPLNLGSPSFLGVCSTFSGDLSTWALLPSLGSVLHSQGTSQPGLSFLPWGLFYVLRGPLNLGSPSFLGVCSTFSGDLSTWALLPSLGSVLRSQGTSQPGLSFLPWGLFYVLRGPLNLGSPSFLGVCSTFSGDLSTWALLPSLGSVLRSQGTSQPGLSFLPWGLFYVLRGPLNLGSPSFLGVCSTFSGDLSTWALLPSLGSVLRSQGTSQPGLSFLPWGLFYVLRGPLNLGSPSFLGVCSTFSGDLSTWALLPSLGSVPRSQGTSQPGLSFLPWGLFYVLRGPLNLGSPSFLGVCSTFSGDLSTWALLPSLGSVLRSQGTSQPGLSFLPWGLFHVLRGPLNLGFNVYVAVYYYRFATFATFTNFAANPIIYFVSLKSFRDYTVTTGLTMRGWAVQRINLLLS